MVFEEVASIRLDVIDEWEAMVVSYCQKLGEKLCAAYFGKSWPSTCVMVTPAEGTTY